MDDIYALSKEELLEVLYRAAKTYREYAQSAQGLERDAYLKENLKAMKDVLMQLKNQVDEDELGEIEKRLVEYYGIPLRYLHEDFFEDYRPEKPQRRWNYNEIQSMQQTILEEGKKFIWIKANIPNPWQRDIKLRDCIERIKMLMASLEQIAPPEEIGRTRVKLRDEYGVPV